MKQIISLKQDGLLKVYKEIRMIGLQHVEHLEKCLEELTELEKTQNSENQFLYQQHILE